ncbi:hypothetical protein ACI68E_000963 [Malassezia pachydermatis]|uniref:B2-aldehyde-forming enzyme n=1 Tax=Malassezia pachydermatis TaxID=77020 RepID=A0A0M8MT20_9BASI|nr:b2-aldehyde-forming enzyme [Malassezia pachydermatis]KOS13051.1 b2-aldehyde-forming enzyme [Malassezia pachydermatis]
MQFTRAAVLSVVALVAGVSAAPAAKVDSRNVFTGGKATWYSAGMSEGNCGWWSTNADHIVALNVEQYGSTDDRSSHCGRLVRIVNNKNNKVLHAVVADSCPSCDFGSLDLSKGLFSDLNDGDLDMGEFPISWSFLN